MSIKRQRRTKNFTVIPNEVFAADLSMPALGLLTYLLSKPDDWQVSLTQLRREFRCGKDYLTERIRELEQRRYLRKQQTRLESGAWGEADYLVVDSPLTENPHPAGTAENPQLPLAGLPSTAQPLPANPPLLKTDKALKTETAPKTDDDRFAEFWAAYPKHVGKKQARIEWAKLEVTEQLHGELLAGLTRYLVGRSFFHDPERFLKHRRWDDEAAPTPANNAEARAQALKDDVLRQMGGGDHAGK